MHGHRYAIEVTLAGPILRAEGRSDNGMVMDFSLVKQLMHEHVVDAWDHAFLVYRGDDAVVQLLAALPDHKTVILDTVPTAENLAATAFTRLEPVFRQHYGNRLQLTRVRIYETPNCWADATDGSEIGTA